MTTITQTIPSLGSPPLTTDPASFDTRADTLYGTSLPAVITATNTWSGQANTVAGEVNTNATTASTNATTATTARIAAEAAQAAAESASDATQWVSGQAYVAGNVVWSPSTYLSYRAVGATSGTVDPSQSASWVLLAANVPRFTNPLAQAVRVAMTAAASGSNGIQVLDNANADFGTGNFTLHWEGSLPDYTPAGTVFLLYKFQDINNRVGMFISGPGAGNKLSIIAVVGGLTIISTASDSTLATVISEAEPCDIDAIIVRESASSNGSVSFLVNGLQFGSTISIPAASTVSLDNTGSLFINGTNAVRNESVLQNAIIYNRALSAAEVLSLCVNGPALADIGASQTNKITNGDFPIDLASWTIGSNTTATWVSGEADINVNTITSSSNNWFSQTNVFETLSTKYHSLEFEATYVSGADLRVGNGFRVIGGVSSSENGGVKKTYRFDFIPASLSGATNNPDRLTFGSLSGAANWKIDNVSVKQTGITGQWNAENAQSNTGQIFDSSGNKNHALLPAAGATIIGKETAQVRQVRWTNTWAGTNELQYIGGVNQAILPAKAYIESIVGTVSGATPHDIIIGDGSDADRYVTITTGLAAGVTSFALASRVTDGTNLKLTVDPDTNATMSIAWVITYTTLES